MAEIKAIIFDFWDTLAQKKINGEAEFYPGTKELIQSISHYTLALISNASTQDPRKHLQKMGLHNHFDHFFLSSETGLIKPDYRIFEHAVETIGHESKHCLFIDDSGTNVHAALACGLVGIVFKGMPQLKKDLEEAGVELRDYKIYN